MSESEARPGQPGAGLCGDCVHAREVSTRRGASFLMCLRSLTDDRFARYPRLPVGECAGYERKPAEGQVVP